MIGRIFGTHSEKRFLVVFGGQLVDDILANKELRREVVSPPVPIRF